jgi:hypothetical protein
MMSKINPLFDDGAGEPAPERGGAVLGGLIGDMTSQVAAAKQHAAESRTEERRLAEMAEKAAQSAGDWEKRAMAAMRAGDDVIARDAFLRKREHELEYERLRGAERDQHQRTAAMTRALLTLNFRVEEARHQHAEVGRSLRTGAGPTSAPAPRETEAMHERLQTKLSDIGSELDLSDAAIAKLSREARDAKPLAKTAPHRTITPPATSLAADVSGPERTKR